MKQWFTDEKKRASLINPFEAFRLFTAGYSGQEDASFASFREIKTENRSIALLGLNSALMCSRRRDDNGEVNDYGVLNVGEPQIHDRLRSIENADLGICIVHHPFEWLHEYDRARVEPALREKSDLILSGHIHRPSIAVEQRPRSNTVVVPAGASYDRRDPQGGPAYANAYNFVSLDLATGKGTIHLRRWDGQNSRWAPDHSTSKDGRFKLKISRAKARRGTPTRVSPAERQSAAAAAYRRRLLESCDMLEVANLPSDHLVSQRELKLRQLFIPTKVVVEPFLADTKEGRGDQEDYLAAWEIARSAPALLGRTQPARVFKPSDRRMTPGLELVAQRVSPGECLQRGPRLIILGDPGSGKTTFTRWLAMVCALRIEQNPIAGELTEAQSLPDNLGEPVLIRCRDLEPGDEKRGILDLLDRCYRANSLSESEIKSLAKHFREALTQRRAFLILDGLDEIADATRRNAFCDRVLELSQDHPALRIFATSRIVGYRETGGRLRHKFLHAKVDDLSLKEKDNFVNRWCSLTEPPERQTQAAAELIRDIHENERIRAPDQYPDHADDNGAGPPQHRPVATAARGTLPGGYRRAVEVAK